MGIIIDSIRHDDSPKALALKTGMALESICADYEYDVFISTYPRRQVTLTAYEDTNIDDIDALDEYALLDDAAQLLTAIKEYLSEMDDALWEQELAREEAEGREFNFRTSNIDLSEYDMEDVNEGWIGMTD